MTERIANGAQASSGPDEHTPEVYVYPGRVVTSAEARHLKTVLGSCVSICLFDPDIGVGGMNHFLLPDPTGGSTWSPRFAAPATQQLIGQLLGLGAHRRRLVAKVFGGCVPRDPRSNGFHVGWRNVEAARRLLGEERIPILGQDVGGPRGRRLVFSTRDGAAWVKAL